MFKLETFSDEQECRTGKLFGTIVTPCFLPPSFTGNSPHLTPDNLEKLPNLHGQMINYSDIFPCENVMKSTGQDLNSMLNLPNHHFIISASDHIHLPMTNNANQKRNIHTTSGRKLISANTYIESMHTLKPHAFVAMSDEVDSSTTGNNRQKKSVMCTLNWLDTCVENKPAECMLIGVVVGGTDRRLRTMSSEETAKRAIDGIMLAGFGKSDTREDRKSLIEVSLQPFSPQLPRFLPDVGAPEDVLDCVASGIDVFTNCYPHFVTKFGYALTFWIDASYELSGRDVSEAFTDGSKLNLRDKRYAEDDEPLLRGCQCFTCQKHTRAYINHLLNVHEMLADVLLYMHNMHHYLQFFEAIQRHVQAGSFVSFRDEFVRRMDEI